MLSKRSTRFKNLANTYYRAITTRLSTSKPEFIPISFQIYAVSLEQNIFELLSIHTADPEEWQNTYPSLKNKINIVPFISTTQGKYTYLTDFKTIICFGYSTDWGRDPFTEIGVASGTRGYLFLTVPSVNEWNAKVYNKINRPYDNIVGPVQITIITHASQINLLNNPDRVTYGPISQFVLDQQSTYPFNNLIYDEDIYKLESLSDSPLYFNDVVVYTAPQNTRVKIFDIIQTGLNSPTVPVSEFQDIWSDATSGDNSIAEVDFENIYYPPFMTIKESKDTILLKKSGTFNLKITQLFYQSSQYNIGYKKKDFNITITLTVFNI